MPGEYTVINNGHWVIEYWSGDINRHDIIEHEKAHLADETISKNAICLVDMRNITSNLSMESIQEVAELNLSHPDGPKHMKIAIVCSDSNIYRKSQLFELSLYKQGVSIITFTSMSVACAWLDMSIEDIEPVIDQMKFDIDSQQSRVA